MRSLQLLSPDVEVVIALMSIQFSVSPESPPILSLIRSSLSLSREVPTELEVLVAFSAEWIIAEMEGSTVKNSHGDLRRMVTFFPLQNLSASSNTLTRTTMVSLIIMSSLWVSVGT